MENLYESRSVEDRNMTKEEWLDSFNRDRQYDSL